MKKESLSSFFKISEDHHVVNMTIRIKISKSDANLSLKDFAHHLFPLNNLVLIGFVHYVESSCEINDPVGWAWRFIVPTNCDSTALPFQACDGSFKIGIPSLLQLKAQLFCR